MSDKLPHSRLLAELPFDVLLNIFDECDVIGILNLSATCKRVNEASGERQTWLNQVRQLKIPIPADIFHSTAELKECATSWIRSDERWVQPRTPDDRSLWLHRFDLRQEEEARAMPFVMANLIPGGNFVVILYPNGQIDLKEIKIKSKYESGLRDVTRYKPVGPERTRVEFWSQLLTETNIRCPLVAYVDPRSTLFVFLVDHIAGTIKRKQAVKLNDVRFYSIYGIHARGNTILCFYEHTHGWGITVSELGPDPALRHFTLSRVVVPDLEPTRVQLFMVSENAVVTCDVEGIHLYHIPELSSTEGPSTLSPVWECLGGPRWFCGGVCTKLSRHPMLYLQGTSGTHTITFRVDASGRDPVVSGHHARGWPPAHRLSLIHGYEKLFVLKGLKGLHYYRNFLFKTCLLGREELAGGFTAEVQDFEHDCRDEHKILFADFDERTGRILIATNLRGDNGPSSLYREDNRPIRIYFADLPP